MKKVLIINEGFSNNLGDQAINNSISKFFKDQEYKTSFLYLSKPNLKKLPNYNYIKTKKISSKNNQIINKIKSYLLFIIWFFKHKKIIINTLTKNDFDLVIIGGGQLIISSGTFALSGFSIYTFWYSYLTKRYSKAKLYMIGVGASKDFNWLEKMLYKKTLKKIDKIWVRDSFSRETIKRIFNIKTLVIPDIAFYCPSYKVDIKKNIALISITNFEEVYKRYNKDGMTKAKYYEKIYYKYLEYKKNGYDVYFFYTTITDANESQEFKEYIYKNHQLNIKILEINTLNDLLAHLKYAKLVYSGRMHALILALKMKCKVEPFLISEKLKSFNKEYILSNKDIMELNNQIKKSLINNI